MQITLIQIKTRSIFSIVWPEWFHGTEIFASHGLCAFAFPLYCCYSLLPTSLLNKQAPGVNFYSKQNLNPPQKIWIESEPKLKKKNSNSFYISNSINPNPEKPEKTWKKPEKPEKSEKNQNQTRTETFKNPNGFYIYKPENPKSKIRKTWSESETQSLRLTSKVTMYSMQVLFDFLASILQRFTEKWDTSNMPQFVKGELALTLSS